MIKLIFFLVLVSVSLSVIIPSIHAIPMERMEIFDLWIVDEKLIIDKQIEIKVNYAMTLDRDEHFTMIFQITDETGKVVMLNWIEGFDRIPESYFEYVCGNKICSVGGLQNGKIISTSWIPVISGDYTITLFVWEYIDTPTVLSPPVSISVTVEN